MESEAGALPMTVEKKKKKKGGGGGSSDTVSRTLMRV